MTYLITGAAGFIGFWLTRSLLEEGNEVIGLDNVNDYYDIKLKESRLSLLEQMQGFTFIKKDLADKTVLERIFSEYRPAVVINLAAQAGVRYSLTNPDSYIQSNIQGFYHILECCRHYPVNHLIFASSSSVYGENQNIPFSTRDKTDEPVSLYAATKKSNELMAHAYSKLYQIPVTGLRFFTVYGPMGRPDMAYYKFAEKIVAGEPIQIYNNGDMYRDFTYIDDVVNGIRRVAAKPAAADRQGVAFKIYNIGNNKPEQLMYFIETLEQKLGKKARKEFLPMQPGDVTRTYADISDTKQDFGFSPCTTIEEGIGHFVDWFLEYKSNDGN